MTSIYDGPWTATGEHPTDWALRTGRITAKSRQRWITLYTDDPVGVGRTLASLYPIAGVEQRLDRLEAGPIPGADPDDDEYAHLFGPVAYVDQVPAAYVNELTDEDFSHLFPPQR